MPGPGAHLLYCLGSSLGLMHASGGKLTVHHAAVYSLNGFTGPDLGSFFEWLLHDAVPGLASVLMKYIHDPIFYPIILGPLLSMIYSWLSGKLLPRGQRQGGLSVRQCLALVTAGALSHFFLDNLFEENGHTIVYSWVLSTGHWHGPVPINPLSSIIIGALTLTLFFGFLYLNLPKGGVGTQFQTSRISQTALLMATVAGLYCLWCAYELYAVDPPIPPVGEEADLGIIVFLAIFFFLPHFLVIVSYEAEGRALGLPRMTLKEVNSERGGVDSALAHDNP